VLAGRVFGLACIGLAMSSEDGYMPPLGLSSPSQFLCRTKPQAH
jgi:hypothetical protein